MKKIILASVAALALTATAASAQEFEAPKAGTIKLDVRATGVIPDKAAKHNATTPANGGPAGIKATVSDDYVPTIGLEYFFTPDVSAELIAGTSFHNVNIKNSARLSEEGVLPPTLTAKYHFMSSKRISPYVGAGIGYLWFYSEDGQGAYKVHVKDGFGAVAQVGTDIASKGKWSYNIDLKKIFIEPKANVSTGGTLIETAKVKLNPWVASVGVGYKF